MGIHQGLIMITDIFQLFAKTVVCPTMHIPQSVLNPFADGEFSVL